MHSSIWQDGLFTWVVILALGFPLIEIILGEVIHHLQRRGKPIATTLRIVRNLVLPTLVVLLFMKNVLRFDANGQLLKIVDTLFWICFIHACLSLINVVLFAETEANTWQAQVPKLFRDLFRFFLVLLGTGIVLSAVWKIDLAGLVTALGIGSIVLGLALQDTLGSIVSGIAILFERPFNVGDWLRIGDIEGKVTDINWRAVRLETKERYLIVIPHLIMGKEIIRNFSKPLRLFEEQITIGFAYDHPPNLVKQVLKATALSTPGVLTNVEPVIETQSYDDCAISYLMRIYIEDYEKRFEIRDELKTRIWYAAKRYNLKIPFPIREIHYQDASQAEGAASKFTENLRSIPVLIRMECESIEDITKGAILQHFAAGEEVITEGDSGNALHLIVAGKALVTITDDCGHKQEVFTLLRGEFFGEMALFTGEPSTVSVVAVDDLEVMLIYSDVANLLIERKPSLAREIGQIMEARRKAINLAKREGERGKG